MIAYIIKDEDIEALLSSLEVDPEKASRECQTPSDRHKFAEAHRFYNYRVRRWIDERVKGKAS